RGDRRSREGLSRGRDSDWVGDCPRREDHRTRTQSAGGEGKRGFARRDGCARKSGERERENLSGGRVGSNAFALADVERGESAVWNSSRRDRRKSDIHGRRRIAEEPRCTARSAAGCALHRVDAAIYRGETGVVERGYWRVSCGY